MFDPLWWRSMLRRSEKMFPVRSLSPIGLRAEFRKQLSLVIPVNPEIPEKSHPE
jgi:hypothetical protein